jgi:hypothetical protein
MWPGMSLHDLQCNPCCSVVDGLVGISHGCVIDRQHQDCYKMRGVSKDRRLLRCYEILGELSNI